MQNGTDGLRPAPSHFRCPVLPSPLLLSQWPCTTRRLRQDGVFYFFRKRQNNPICFCLSDDGIMVPTFTITEGQHEYVPSHNWAGRGAPVLAGPYREPGQERSRSAYCRQHRLSYHALTYWLRKQSQPVMQAAPLLSLVEVPAHVLPASAPFRLSIGGEYLVELDAAFDEAALSLPELLARFGTEEQYRQELFHLMAGSA